MATGFESLQAALGDRYRLDGEIGRGAMAVVLAGYDLKHQRPVAIKVLKVDLVSSDGSSRFLREVLIAASLQHPHILPVFDSGEAAGHHYYVMPLVQGRTLRDRLTKERQLPVDEALRYGREIADALSFAHAHNVIHRDIKPANVLLSAGHALVADFGIARALTQVEGERITGADVMVGTPEYMSPEQSSGGQEVDHRSDIYGLGCVVFEMLAGEAPFTGPNPLVIASRHLTDRAPDLRLIRSTVPETIAAAVAKSLEKTPADRQQTAHEFGVALGLSEPAAVGAADAEMGAPALGVPWRPRTSDPGARPVSRITWEGLRHLSITSLNWLGLATLVLLAGWFLTRPDFPPLDVRHVAVFPLADDNPAGDAGLGTDSRAGDMVASYIGYVLDGTDPLRWEEAGDWLSPEDRADPGSISMETKLRVARDHGAGYFMDGTIIRATDSVTVGLRLFDAESGSMVGRSAKSGLSGDIEARLGALAVAELLPLILDPGRSIDRAALRERSPSAVANFLLGEAAFRGLRVSEALDYYELSVGADSTFALAALRGAQAAQYINLSGDANVLSDVALEHIAFLPTKYALLAQGLDHYLEGNGDSAVARLREAVVADPEWSDAWLALGEAYYYLLPGEFTVDGGNVVTGLLRDSLARAAFRNAERFASDPLLSLRNLVDFDVKAGDVESAVALLERFEGANEEFFQAPELRLRIDCLREGPADTDWGAAAEREPLQVLAAAQQLSAGLLQAECSEAATHTLLGTAAVTAERWGAFLILGGLLAAQGRHDELRALVASPEVAGLPARKMYLPYAAAGLGFAEEAATVATELRENLAVAGSPDLWLLGEYEAFRQNGPALSAIVDQLAERVANGGVRRDELIHRALEAQLALVRGDTTLAVTRLEALRATGTRADIVWQPWEALVPESMRLAELYLAAGDVSKAHLWASEIDSDRAVSYVIHVPWSLDLRSRAASALGDPALAEKYDRRLSRLVKATWPPSPN